VSSNRAQARCENAAVTFPPARRARRAGPRWTLVLPVKGGPTAKSRLGAPPALASAIALDCLDAVLGCPDVARAVVVTADDAAAAAARAAGADVVRESRPGAGLRAALDDGLAAAEGPVAVLLADLPALRPADLSAALREAARALRGPDAGPDAGAGGRDDAGDAAPAMAFVPDADRTGTVLLAGLDPAAVRPAFGPGSAAEHARSGARRLDLSLPRLRRDVDTREDLATALALGVGPRTAAAVSAITGEQLPAALP
jgi:2-phospho-L-lactate guanylyltransferase